MSRNLCNMLQCNPSKSSIFVRVFLLLNRLLRLKSAITTFSPPVLSKTLESRLIHTSPLFLMSTTSVALFRVRFIALAESENIFRKRILSALSMPSFYRNWIIVIVCFMDCPLVELRNLRDCRTPR